MEREVEVWSTSELMFELGVVHLEPENSVGKTVAVDSKKLLREKIETKKGIGPLCVGSGSSVGESCLGEAVRKLRESDHVGMRESEDLTTRKRMHSILIKSNIHVDLLDLPASSAPTFQPNPELPLERARTPTITSACSVALAFCIRLTEHLMHHQDSVSVGGDVVRKAGAYASRLDKTR
ncbi:hypothetical protein B0H10DRAFT_2190472 [Mycena sp. CBHHK59/15]|nr:hypothetical protein B0H10DRAFT_2190472 [Mycena sp. CBHHK59/15]